MKRGLSCGTVCYYSVDLLHSLGRKSWSLELKREHKLSVFVFQKRALKEIFKHKKDVIGGWRKLHSDEFHDLYSPSNMIRLTKSRRIRLTRGGIEEKFLQGTDGKKPNKKRPAERARCRCENNFKMYLIVIGWEDMD